MSKRIALLGQPNSGKSTVYNTLTGSRQHVGNWPGKTVEKNEGTYTYNGETFNVIDLPGSYGLSGNSDEEVITTEYIRNGQADLTIVLVDASQLERTMFMLAEFAELNKPAILLLNMMDVAKAMNKTVDDRLLAERLGIPVLPFVAAEKKDYDVLKKLVKNELDQPHYLKSKPAAGEGNDYQAKYNWIREMLDGVTDSAYKKYVLSKWDKRLLSPVKGKFLCLAIVLLGFLVAMGVCMPFMAFGSMIPGLLNQPIADFLNGLHVHPCWSRSSVC